MGKISNFFKKRFLPCVMAGTMIFLPICLTGCDSDPSKQTQNNGSNLETGVNDAGDNPAGSNNAGNTSNLGDTSGSTSGTDDTSAGGNSAYPETLNELLSRTTYEGNDDKVIHPAYQEVIENTFKEFSIIRLLNNEYYANLSSVITPYIELTAAGNDIISTYVYVNYHQASAINDLISAESSYAFDVYKYNETDGNSYQLLKDGADTFLIIITKKSGEKLYNGFYNGTAYTDGVEYFTAFNFPVLTAEYLSAINQKGVENPALLWGQNVLSFCLGGSFLNEYFKADVFNALKFKDHAPVNDSTGFNFEKANLGGVVTSKICILENKDYKGNAYSPIQTRIHYSLTSESLATEQDGGQVDEVLGSASLNYTRTIFSIEAVVYYGDYTAYKEVEQAESGSVTTGQTGSNGESSNPAGSSLDDDNSEPEPIVVDEELYPEVVLLGLTPTTIESLTLPQ